MPRTILQLKDIVKNYTLGPVVVKALKNISLSIDEGEMVAVVGPSGCGKSTLMNIMGLLDEATEGMYTIEGMDTSTANDNELSKLRNSKIGFVFQSYYLLQKLNVLNNVSIPLIYRGMGEGKIKEKCREMLKQVGMLEREHHKPNELSGGQQQRVAIARALVGEPALILADEPTGALDFQTSEDIMNLFFELNQKKGITIVLITHDMEIAKACPRRIVLKDGSIIGDEKG